MKRFFSLIVGVAALFTAGSLLAHHSFASMFDEGKVIRLKGVVTKFEWINPHSYIVADVIGADGKTEQWALEGPTPRLLTRLGYSETSIKPGETIEVCGYGTKEGLVTNRRVMLAELLTLPDGGLPRLWQDYGQHRCRDAQGPNGFRGHEFKF
jgi:Family of unknown function (DUF6152)